MTGWFPMYPALDGYVIHIGQTSLSKLSMYRLQSNIGTFCIGGHYPKRLRLTGYLNINNIQIVPKCGCSKYLKVDWMRVTLTNDMKHVIRLPSRGQIMLWTVHHLTVIDSREMYQIQVLSRILDDIMNPLQNTGGDFS